MENKFSTKTIHIATEVVVLGGLSYYFYRKCSTLSNKMDALEKENAEMKQVLQQHETYFRNMFQQRVPEKQILQHPPPIYQRVIHQQEKTPEPIQQSIPKQTPEPIQQNIPEPTPEITPDISLDEELKEEFEELTQEK